jgi:hypothetical protein
LDKLNKKLLALTVLHVIAAVYLYYVCYISVHPGSKIAANINTGSKVASNIITGPTEYGNTTTGGAAFRVIYFILALVLTVFNFILVSNRYFINGEFDDLRWPWFLLPCGAVVALGGISVMFWAMFAVRIPWQNHVFANACEGWQVMALLNGITWADLGKHTTPFLGNATVHVLNESYTMQLTRNSDNDNIYHFHLGGSTSGSTTPSVTTIVYDVGNALTQYQILQLTITIHHYRFRS